MKEDLTAPYPGFGFGALDAFDGYISYRCLDENALAHEIADMRELYELSRIAAVGRCCLCRSRPDLGGPSR